MSSINQHLGDMVRKDDMDFNDLVDELRKLK
jgi:hypothetical protein